MNAGTCMLHTAAYGVKAPFSKRYLSPGSTPGVARVLHAVLVFRKYLGKKYLKAGWLISCGASCVVMSRSQQI